MNCFICNEGLIKSKGGKENYHLTCPSQCMRAMCSVSDNLVISYYLQMDIDNKTYQFTSQRAGRKGFRERAWLSIYKQDPNEKEFIAHSFKTMIEFDKHTPLEDIEDPEQFFRRLIKLRMFS